MVPRNAEFHIALDAHDKVTGMEIDALCATIQKHFGSFGEDNPPVGFAYAINGKPVNVRCFAHARIFSKQFDPFLRALATEAQLAEESEHKTAQAWQVAALVTELQEAKEEMRGTTAFNKNGVRLSLRGYAATCYVPAAGSKEPTVITRDWTAK